MSKACRRDSPNASYVGSSAVGTGLSVIAQAQSVAVARGVALSVRHLSEVLRGLIVLTGLSALVRETE
jgi:hypothetical protein